MRSLSRYRIRLVDYRLSPPPPPPGHTIENYRRHVTSDKLSLRIITQRLRRARRFLLINANPYAFNTRPGRFTRMRY